MEAHLFSSNIFLLDYAKNKVISWEDQTSFLRVHLFPNQLANAFTLSKELNQVVIKENLHMIYTLYVRSITSLHKIINFKLIFDKKESIFRNFFGFEARVILFYFSICFSDVRFLQQTWQYS